jgi:hypothetical protein
VKHGPLVAFDMDLRDAWFPNSRLSRGLMVSYKWRVVHGSTNICRPYSARF